MLLYSSGMLGLVCNDATSLSPSTQLDSLTLFTSTLDAGAAYGPVSVDEGASLLATVSTVMLASSLTRNTSEISTRATMASASMDALNRLSVGLGTGMVPGQAAAVLVSGDVEIQAQVYDDLTSLDMNAGGDRSSNGFVMSSSGNISPDTLVCASLNRAQDNIYEGEILSAVLSLTLFDCETNVELEYTDGDILIEMASSPADGDDTECSYWDNEVQPYI